MEPGVVDGPSPPEHVGVPSPEVVGDEAGGHAFERGGIAAAGEVFEFGIMVPGVADGGLPCYLPTGKAICAGGIYPLVAAYLWRHLE